MSNRRLYSDIDLKFITQPGTKDVSMSYDSQSVIRSIRNLILTRPTERLFQPELSSQIDFLLFEPINSLTASLLEKEVTRIIENWEPRARIASLSVSARPDINSYSVSLFVYIGNKAEPTGVSLVLKRSR